MDPFQSEAARQTIAKVGPGAAHQVSPGERFTQWATTPINVPNRMKTPAQVKAQATPGVQVAAPSAPALPEWARSQVSQGGGSPANFHVEGSQLMSSRSPESIKADITAHPPITTEAGQALASNSGGFRSVPPQAPIVKPASVGLQSPGASQVNPGVQVASHDPARAALQAQLQQAHRDASRYGQGQWVFPPGTGTEPVWQPNTAHERIAAYGNALANYNQTDPMAAVSKIDAINADPMRRSTALAMGGMNGQEQSTLHRPAMPGEPSDQVGAYDPQAASQLSNPQIGLAEHAAHFAGQPGAGGPGNPNAAAFQDWINQHYANQHDWDEDTYVPPDPGQLTHPLGQTGVRAAGLIHSLFTGVGNAFGAGNTSAGTGLGWDQHRADRVRLNEMLQRIGVHGPVGSENAGIPPQ